MTPTIWRDGQGFWWVLYDSTKPGRGPFETREEAEAAVTPRDNPPPGEAEVERIYTVCLAVDPGPEESAYVEIGKCGTLIMAHKAANERLLEYIRCRVSRGTLVIEQIAAMGMSVGAEVFETVFWSGRFAEAFGMEKVARVKRHEVKMHLCGNTRAKDGNIRQAIIDRYGPGKEKAIGNKKKPGPLHGVSGDCWQALAAGLTWLDKSVTPPA